VKLFKHLLLGTVLAASLQLTGKKPLVTNKKGINTVFYYGPEIIQAAGIRNPLLLNLAIGTWNFFTSLFALAFVDKIGRRPLLIFGVTTMGISLFGLGIALHVPLSELYGFLLNHLLMKQKQGHFCWHHALDIYTWI
jgi:MFS family permease